VKSNSILYDDAIFRSKWHGGICRYFRELLRGLAHDATFTTTVLSFSGEALNRELPARFEQLPSSSPLRGSGYLGSIGKSINRHRENVVLCNYWSKHKPGVYHSTIYRAAPGLQLPEVCTLYDMIPEKHDEFRNEWAKQWLKQKHDCMSRSEIILSISETSKAEAVSMLSIEPQKIKVVHLGCSDFFFCDDNIHPIPVSYANFPFMLFVGERRGYKNFQLLLSALAESNDLGEMHLVAVGSSWFEEEISLIERLGIGHRVHLCSTPSDEMLRHLYHKAAAFIFPSLEEGFGLPLLEAMACGCPVVASDIPCFREIGGELPLYFSANDPDALAKACVAAMNRPRSSFLHEYREHAKQFSWRKTVQQTANAYLEVASC